LLSHLSDENSLLDVGSFCFNHNKSALEDVERLIFSTFLIAASLSLNEIFASIVKADKIPTLFKNLRRSIRFLIENYLMKVTFEISPFSTS